MPTYKMFHRRMVPAIMVSILLTTISVVLITNNDDPKIATMLRPSHMSSHTSEQRKELIRDIIEGIQLRPNFLKPEAINKIRERAVSNDIVLLTAEYTYREVLMNWILNAEKQGIQNWIICCFDSHLDHWLRIRGSRCHITIPSIYLPSSEPEILYNRHCRGQDGYSTTTDSVEKCLSKACPSFYNTNCLGASFTKFENNSGGTCIKCVGNPMDEFVSAIPQNGTHIALYGSRYRIWHLRWLAAMDIMALGLNVAFVDLDAIVVKNFFMTLHNIPADVIAQRDFGPNKAVAVWGNSICMGFSYWKVGNRKRNEMIKNVERILQRSGDDQSSVANALLIEGVRFNPRLLENDTVPRVGRSPSGFTLGMLPFSSFSRRCPSGFIERDSHILSHCVFGGKSSRKKTSIKRLGGWLLTRDWEHYIPPPKEKFPSYLKNIVNKTTEECYETKPTCLQYYSRTRTRIIYNTSSNTSNSSTGIFGKHWLKRFKDITVVGTTTTSSPSAVGFWIQRLTTFFKFAEPSAVPDVDKLIQIARLEKDGVDKLFVRLAKIYPLHAHYLGITTTKSLQPASSPTVVGSSFNYTEGIEKLFKKHNQSSQDYRIPYLVKKWSGREEVLLRHLRLELFFSESNQTNEINKIPEILKNWNGNDDDLMRELESNLTIIQQIKKLLTTYNMSNDSSDVLKNWTGNQKQLLHQLNRTSLLVKNLQFVYSKQNRSIIEINMPKPYRNWTPQDEDTIIRLEREVVFSNKIYEFYVKHNKQTEVTQIPELVNKWTGKEDEFLKQLSLNETKMRDAFTQRLQSFFKRNNRESEIRSIPALVNKWSGAEETLIKQLEVDQERINHGKISNSKQAFFEKNSTANKTTQNISQLIQDRKGKEEPLLKNQHYDVQLQSLYVKFNKSERILNMTSLLKEWSGRENSLLKKVENELNFIANLTTLFTKQNKTNKITIIPTLTKTWSGDEKRLISQLEREDDLQRKIQKHYLKHNRTDEKPQVPQPFSKWSADDETLIKQLEQRMLDSENIFTFYEQHNMTTEISFLPKLLKKWIGREQDFLNHVNRLVVFFTNNNNNRTNDVINITNLVAEWSGREEELFKRLQLNVSIDRIHSLYVRYNKTDQITEIPDLLKKWSGSEDDLFKQLLFNMTVESIASFYLQQNKTKDVSSIRKMLEMWSGREDKLLEQLKNEAALQTLLIKYNMNETKLISVANEWSGDEDNLILLQSKFQFATQLAALFVKYDESTEIKKIPEIIERRLNTKNDYLKELENGFQIKKQLNETTI